jgi:hypothetical protein
MLCIDHPVQRGEGYRANACRQGIFGLPLILTDTRAAESDEERFSFASLQGASAQRGKAATRTHQCVVDVPDVRQIGRKDDLAALGAHHPVRHG